MKARYYTLLVILTAAALLTACGGQTTTTAAPVEEVGEAATAEEPTATATESPPTATEPPPTETPTPAPTATPAPVPNPLWPDAQPIDFEAEDGVALAGVLWPARYEGAPVIVLMHMYGENKEGWEGVARALQDWHGEASHGSYLALAAGEGPSYNVFTFDFRGHGASGGSREDVGILRDAEAAINYVTELPGHVDSARVVMIGASIGADAAIDVCSGLADGVHDNCLGAMPISPGGYLGIPFPDAVIAMGEKPIYCMASEGDTQSADACSEGAEAAVGPYSQTIYPGSAHGMDIFLDGETREPLPLDVVFEFLNETAPITVL